MKTLEAIRKAIKKNRDRIEAAETEITVLSFADERRANADNLSIWKEYNEKAKANAEKIAALCDEIYLLKVEDHVLKDNERARIVSDFLPVFIEAVKDYNGKQYGEKTREKIEAKTRAAGFSFHFSGYSTKDALKVAKLNANGCAYSSDYITLYSGIDFPYITSENRLNICAENIEKEFPVVSRYTENTKAAAKKIIKAYNAYRDELKKAEEMQNELNAILPAGIDHFHKVSSINNTII